MAAATVRDVLGEIPALQFEWNPHEVPDPSKIWASHDEESDSFILYTTGKPRPGIKVGVGDDTYVIVDRASRKAIGLYVEHWESRFVPAHLEIRALWESLKPTPIVTSDAWIALLRMMALWIIMSLGTSAEDSSTNLQPA